MLNMLHCSPVILHSFLFFALKNVLVLLVKCDSGKLHCPATALIRYPSNISFLDIYNYLEVLKPCQHDYGHVQPVN